MDYRSILTTSFANIDLNSASATRAPTFSFPRSNTRASPITLLRCSDPRATCIHIKDWLLQSFNNDVYAADGIVRIENQELHLLPVDRDGKAKEGWMLLAEDAALMETAFGDGKMDMQITIIAVLVPRDPRVRWFYTLLPIAPLLQRLDDLQLIHLHRAWNPGSHHHKRFSAYIREEFTAAIAIPEAPDFLNAEQLTDCCPPMLEPDTALQRLEQNEFLYFALRNPARSCLDLSDDRYLLQLHPAEREVASLVNLKCAEYMLVKRDFFKVFFEEIYRSDKKIDPNASSFTTTSTLNHCGGMDSVVNSRQNSEVPPSQSATLRRRSEREGTQTPAPPDSVRRGGGRPGYRNRVRTEHAHQGWLEREYEFRSSRAKMLVVAWRELGFLDEGRYLDWVRAGGMLEHSELGGEVRGEGEGDVNADGCCDDSGNGETAEGEASQVGK